MSTIRFYNVSDEYGAFSNFSSHSIFLDGTTWRTVEHYFQAQKFRDGKIMYEIQMAETPHKAAELGRRRDFNLREDWEEIKDEVMLRSVRTKFLQHEEILNLLLSTGDAIIIEHTTNDKYWGDGGDGSGQNKLGRILMSIRSELKDKKNNYSFDDLKLPPWLMYPEIEQSDFMWSMGELEGYLIEWKQWYLELTSEHKRKYKEKYPEPKNWKGFYT